MTMIMTMTMTMTMTMIMTRFIYVCYAERGLVRHGRPELLLANILYLVNEECKRKYKYT